MNSLLAQFIPEARDLIDRAATGILVLEGRPEDHAAINEVFRAVHTLKGTSGLFDVGPLTRLVHAAEDLLDEARAGGMALNSEIVDGLLESLDVVGRWIDALEHQEKLPDGAEVESSQRAVALRGWLAGTKPNSQPAAALAAAGRKLEWLVKLPEAERLAAFKVANGRPLTAWRFEPEEDCFFRGDDPLAMVRFAPGVLALQVEPNQDLGALDSLDPLQCWLTFHGVSDATPGALAEHFRYVAERVEIVEIADADLVLPVGSRADGPVFRDFTRLARLQIEAGRLDPSKVAALTSSISTLAGMTAPASLQASALRWCAALLDGSGLERAVEIEALIAVIETGNAHRLPPLAAPVAFATDPQREPNLGERLALEQIEAWLTPGPADIATGRFEALARTLRGLFLALGREAGELEPALAALRHKRDAEPLRKLISRPRPREAALTPATPSAPAAVKAAEPAAADGPGLPRVLRVDQGKIDSIVNLVAELIVAKNSLQYLADRAEREHGSRAMSREIKEAYSVVDRITQGLHLGVMSVRMMPVNQVLQRFPRLVRDVARALGKKVELVIEGEDTEADKNVPESLADPLIHIVRNSLDHGVETPAERLALGKPEQGTVRIAARNEADFVVIEVSDDGRGVDTARVREKAVKQGILTAERAEQMSEIEAANLIFLPGVSTKDEVSDLSGRGVGMDVVRTTVVKAGGDVTLRNAPGRGSSVIIRLPLTMAVTRIVTVDCCGQLFGIPMDLIAETVRLERKSIQRVSNAEAFVLRNAIVPIARLAERLGLDSGETQAEEEAVIVVNIGGELVGVVVDGFRERLETVVKPLSGILEGALGFSGTALLGDGRVLLILDLAEIL